MIRGIGALTMKKILPAAVNRLDALVQGCAVRQDDRSFARAQITLGAAPEQTLLHGDRSAERGLAGARFRCRIFQDSVGQPGFHGGVAEAPVRGRGHLPRRLVQESFPGRQGRWAQAVAHDGDRHLFLIQLVANAPLINCA